MKAKNIFQILAILLFLAPALAITDFVEIKDYIIDYSYDIPEAGDKFTLKVTVTNDDNNQKENLKLELDLEAPLDNIGDDDWDIGTLDSEETVTKHFRLEVDNDASNDDYEIEFTFEDKDDKWDDFFTIEVESINPELVISDITSDPTTIIADREDIKLIINLQNTGDGDANYVRANLNLPNGFSNSNSFSDISYLGTINAGENKEAVFYIDSEETLNSELHSASINLDYQDENGDTRTETLNFNLPTKGIPQFSIESIITDPLQVSQGATVDLKVNIKNKGTEEAKETSVKVFEKTDYPFSFSEKTNFIGNMQPKETATALFEFEVEKDARPKIYLVNIQIRTVSRDNVLVTEETIQIQINKKQENSGGLSYLLPLLLLAVLIILIAYVLLTSKKKKTKRLTLPEEPI